MITYLLPTRNRPERLAATLEQIGALDRAAHDACEGAEVIVVDNASFPPVESLEFPGVLQNGLPLRILTLNENRGAAARNLGAEAARGDWIVMLDDDSYPLSSDHVAVLRDAPPDVAAIGAEITLPDGQREAGGLPEVFIGCGVAIRRDAFLAVGGYDPSFDYYAEEYDFCARLISAGWRIVHDLRFQVRHEKVNGGRDMNAILHRLVRNNVWVAQRYTPDESLEMELARIINRYGQIAVKEGAAAGYASGVAELLQTLHAQPHRPLSLEHYDRFTGLAHARKHLSGPTGLQAKSGVARKHLSESTGLQAKSGMTLTINQSRACGVRVAIVEPGKNEWVVRAALSDIGAVIVPEDDDPDVLIIGTLSPGPMLDARDRCCARGHDVIMPWEPVSELGQLKRAATVRERTGGGLVAATAP